MRINIKNNRIESIDFLSVDEGIEFIKKFNKDTADSTINISPNYWTTTNINKPQEPWYGSNTMPCTYKVEDPVPNPYIVTCKTDNI